MFVLNYIDNFLNSITMYRLVLYGLLAIAIISLILSGLGILSFTPTALLVSFMTLVATCYGTNFVFSRLFRATPNDESSLITALILFLILSPVTTFKDLQIAFMVGALAMMSKYVFAIGKKHLFNPAAIALVILGVLGNGNGIWWVGSSVLLPVVAIVGLLIVRKIRRFHLFLSFCVTSVGLILLSQAGGQVTWLNALMESFTSWPLIFFATVMLTEPQTAPPTKYLQMTYGAIVGLLFSSQFHVGPLFSTPELALVIGNIFVYLVSSKQKLWLELQNVTQLSTDMYEFSFKPDQKLAFAAGQYLEWTLAHTDSDSRGNRRYFTIASAPTESDIKLGVKIEPQHSSSFKQNLMAMKPGDRLIASQLTGDFSLPTDASKKLVFIAGGIGITPFRSMIKYLLDTQQLRDIVLLYAASADHEFAYKNVFAEAVKKLGIKVVYIITREENVPTGWKGRQGHITVEMLAAEVPDFKQRMYYLSGPNSMVKAYQRLLAQASVPAPMIITDYFPGF